jgi:hypothetical protein
MHRAVPRGAANKVVAALLSSGLIREQVTDSHAKADPALNTFWRNLDDGRGVLLLVTAAGLGALGLGSDAPTAAFTAAVSAEAPEDSTTTQTLPAGPPSLHAGNQAFSFIGAMGFSGAAGQLRVQTGILSGDFERRPRRRS